MGMLSSLLSQYMGSRAGFDCHSIMTVHHSLLYSLQNTGAYEKVPLVLLRLQNALNAII